MQSFHPIWHHINKGEPYWMDMERVIGAALAGDQKAIARLYNAYSHKVLGICVNIVGNRAVAEELAHDAFVLAFSKLDHLRDPNRFDAWLSSITTNVALRYKRRHHELTTVPIDNISDNTLIEDDSMALPSMQEIMAAINTLPNGYGKVFKMAVMQEMSHQEIGNILGIAAHSSSSQLVRAKKMLRQSLAKYWPVVLLALLTPIAILLLRTPKTDDKQPVITKQETPDAGLEQPKEPQVQEPLHKSNTAIATVPETYKKKAVSSTDSIPDEKHEEPVEKSIDTTAAPINKTLPHLKLNGDIHFAQGHQGSTIQPKKDDFKRWSVDMAYMGQTMPEGSLNQPYAFVVKDYLAPSVPGEPDPIRNISNWSDYIAYLDECTDIISETDEESKVMRKIAMSNEPFNNGQIVRSAHHNLPLTYSLSLRYQAGRKIGIESGLMFTRLNSTFHTGEGANRIDESQRINYLGVPVKVNYRIWSGKHVGIYTSAGVTLEIPVRSTVTTDYILNNQPVITNRHHLDVPLQWSTGVGIGVQYNITPSIGLFVEPGLQYYIPDGSGIETYRTQHPFTITVPAGLRFTW